jgi:hypothetical protein
VNIPWQPLALVDRLKVVIAMIMVKLNKLKYDQFSEDELNQLITSYLPQQVPLSVPVGKANLSLLKGELSMPTSTNRLQLQLLCGIEIRVLANPIYRAHLVILVSADPMYFVNKNLLTIKAIRVDDVALVQDEYALLSDTSKLIDAISPVQIGGLLTSPMRSALNIITAGTSNTALQYLQMYIGGSKQRILDYHRHQIEDHVISAVAKADINMQLDPAEWRQNLFARLGKDVVVEDKQLRFYF